MDQLSVISAYAIPLALLAWLWLAGKQPVRIKLLITAVLPLFYLLHWQGLQDISGWPATQPLPERFELLAADVIEPDASANIAGTVHLWVRQEEHGKPRVYALPYTRKLHEELHTARQRMQAGKPQLGSLSTGGSRGAPVSENQRLEFRDVNRRILPPK